MPGSRRALVAGSSCALALAVGLAVTTPLAASAAPPSRVTVDVPPAWAASAPVVGAPAASTPLRMSLVLALRDAAGAERLAADVSDPASPRYGKYVTAAQWRAAYAPAPGTVTAVRGFLTRAGFTVGDVPANRRTVSFTGTVAQAQAAFGTTLRDYAHAGGRATAPAGPVTVPAELGGLVVGVQGLDSSDLATPSRITPGSDAPARTAPATVSGSSSPALPPPGPVFRNSGPCSEYFGEKKASDLPQPLPHPLTYAPCGYDPVQLRGAYGMDEAVGKGLDGRGATVAIVDAYASPTITRDAKTYAQRNDPTHPLRDYQFRQVLPATYTDQKVCGPQGWYGEETLDVEAVHATAPAANILYVGASSCYNADLAAAVNSVVDNQLAQVVSNSYGSAGEPKTASGAKVFHQTAVQAAAQGVSLLFSSGDDGDEIDNTGKRQVDSPASDPLVTAVGGTSLMVGSANGYRGEQGWGTGRTYLVDGQWQTLPAPYLYGGGGGTSRIFDQPKYQAGVVPADIADHFGTGSAHRAVPDVAMVGDPNTGMLVGQTQQFPDGSYQYSEYRIGGTSLSSPLFGGVVALALQRHGGPLGFLNPKMYKLAGTAALHDVDHGRKVTDGVVRVDYANGFDDSDGLLTSLRTLGQTGSIYTRPGYDDVTGIGTPNGLTFLNGLGG